MAKDAVVRFTDTLAEMRTLGIPALTNMAECIRRGTASRLDVMRDIGTHLSLGFYWNHSDENREQRKLVRACLMLRVILGGWDYDRAFKKEKTRLEGLTTALLRNDLTTQLGNALPTPTQIQTVSCNGGPQADSLQHCLRWGSSNGSMVSLCYIATREMVWYRTFKFTGRGSISIPAYGNENGWKHRMFAPWWPVLQFAPDNPSTTNWHPNGLMGNATDNHTLPPQGPHVDMQIGNLSDRLEETEVHAEQIYQYNATGDPATWERDRQGSGVVSVTHPNDRHWTDFLGGKWKIIRRIYKGQHRTWMYELKKTGGEGCNSGEVYTRTCPVKGPTGAPMTY